MFAFEFVLSLAANANLQPKSHESARSSKYPGDSTEQVDTAPRAPTIGSSRLASRSSISSVARIDSSRRATANLFVLDRYQQKKIRRKMAG